METKKKTTELDIISKYMDHVLTHGAPPKSIYKFTKDLDIEESEFYQFFSSFKHLETEIFTVFFSNTVSLLDKNKEFKEFASKDKLLSFYFTFFENLTANRSYILYALDPKDGPLKSMKKLQGLKHSFVQFISALNIDKIDLKQDTLQKLQERGFEEAFWIQMLLVLKFWMNDTSASFEKTDLFIEKSIHASFDIINTQPVRSFIDLGKFILKERMDFKL